jgi:hypothetical protein
VPPVDVYSASNENIAGSNLLKGPALYRSHNLGDAGTWSQYSGHPQSPIFSFAVGTYQNDLAGRGPGSFVYLITVDYPVKDFLFVDGAGVTGWLNATPPGVTTNGSFAAPVIVTHPGWDATSAQTAWLLVNNLPRVFVTTNAAGLSPDGNPRWTEITGDLPPVSTLVLTDLVIDPVLKTLYLGTSSGVFKSVNNGGHWTRWFTNLPALGDQFVERLRTADFRPGGSFNVYAGLWGSGIWWRDGSE